MNTEKKQPQEVPAAAPFYSLSQFSTKPFPHAREPLSKVSLRQKAEAHFREREELSSENLDALSPESMRTILYELRVHQIQLEMQNEDLRRAQADLNASRARYFDLYDLAPVGYCSVSEKGLILEANLTAATLLHRERDALVGKGLANFISKGDQELYYLCRKKLLDTRQPQECDLQMVRPDSTAFFAHLEITVASDENGEPVCRIALIDVTDRKMAEKELKTAKTAAESATRTKSEFLAMMTHELRTPLNGMMGFSELLSDTPLNDEQREYAQTISSSGEHLLSIINDILDFSSMENGRLYLHSAPFSIAGLLESSILSVRKSAIEKGLDLLSETGSGVPELMTSDERRVRQILINLLGNAVKFTSAGSVVLRFAASTSGNQPAVDFSVEDTGLGISAEALGRLFQPFTQASSAIGRSFGGTGLGLSISRRLAEAMNGTVTVTSTLGKGSIFTLRLPLEVPAGGMASVPSHLFIGADGASPSSPSAEPLARPVLVVDDDRASGVVAVKMLQNLGHRVEFVTNGAEAIEAFSPGKYSAIFMDVAMPVMDGLDATGKIREIEAASGCHVPIIAFTAQAMIGERERCLAAGMDDYLSKPFKKDEIAAKLACWQSRSHAPIHHEK